MTARVSPLAALIAVIALPWLHCAPRANAQEDVPQAEDEDVLDADELDALFRELEAGPTEDEPIESEAVQPTSPTVDDTSEETPTRRQATRLRPGEDPAEESGPAIGPDNDQDTEGSSDTLDTESGIDDTAIDESDASGVMVPREAFRQQPVVRLRGLDKITGRYSDLQTETGNPIIFGTLEVTVDACFDTPPEYPREAAAFLQVKSLRPIAPESMPVDVATRLESLPENAPERDTPVVFSGWMYASSPGLNALEHPVYDIWVMSCSAS